MDEATKEFQKTTSNPEEMEKQIERLQRRMMNEIRPLTEELHKKLATETKRDIKEAVREATDDLHINQSKLTSELEEKVCMRTETLDLMPRRHCNPTSESKPRPWNPS